ncbi:MAG: GAF domain-containing protein [Cyclobacteriaceae bacterium]|nr:GAF domain-containing protein [Cyclobacteriaceae bacterium]
MKEFLLKWLELLKNPQKRSLILTALFYTAILISAYVLFRLQYNLKYEGGMTPSPDSYWVFAKAFIIIFIAFGLGITTINYSQKIRKEVIVFKEVSSQQTNTASDVETANFTLDKKTFANDLKNAKKNEIKQVGLNSICDLLKAGQGAWYDVKKSGETKTLTMTATFALPVENMDASFQWGEGLVGQAAASGKSIYLDELPEGYNNAILSGLGSAQPKFLLVASVHKGDQVVGVLEIATFSALPENVRTQAIELATMLVEG